MVSYNWRDLEKKCPMNISKLKEHINMIEPIVITDLSYDNVLELKPKLIDASSELEILMNKLITLLYDYESLKSETDRALFAFLQDNTAGYLSLIDERQNQLLETFDSTQDKMSINRTAAFKKLLKVALYGVIWNSLDYSSQVWSDIVETNDIQKDNRTFLRIFFMVFSINLSVAGGMPRRKVFGLAGANVVGKPVLPSTWKAMFSKNADQGIRDEYKKRYGEDLPMDDFDNIDDLETKPIQDDGFEDV